MKLRQVAIAARELEPYRTQMFERVGLQADFADPGVGEFGLENSVMAFGTSFFEIVAPIEENTAAGRSLDKAGVDACGYMLLFQVDNYAEFDAHIDQLKLRKVWHVDTDEVSACHVHPKDMSGAIVSFDEMRPAESWLWGGPDWPDQQAQNCGNIVGATLSCPDPQALAEHWGTILQAPARRHNDHLRIDLQEQTFVDFVEGADTPQLTAMTVVTDQQQLLEPNQSQLQLGNFSVHFINPD